MSVLWPLHVALTARLRGDATLMALLPGGVHSGSAPSTATRPYLVMDAPQEEEENTLDRFGKTAFIQLNAVSAPSVRSTQQVDAILDRVEALLRTPLVLTGHASARARPDFRTTEVEDDETRHGVARYRITTFEDA